MDIQINLYKDMIELVNKEIDNLKQNGFTFEEYSDWEQRRLGHLTSQRLQFLDNPQLRDRIDKQMKPEALLWDFKVYQAFRYIDLQRRIPDVHPRMLRYSSQFSCPPERKEGLQMLEEEIKSGKPLFRRLSRKIYNALEQDGMLFDWGIIHFHLGTKPDTKYPSLMEGHSEILYAILDTQCAYLLSVDKHGRWTDKDLLRLVKKDFPHLLEPYRIKGDIKLIMQPTAKEHLSLRKVGLNVKVELDGATYMGPGGGINSAGGSIHSTKRLHQVRRWYQTAEKIITEHIERLVTSEPGFRLNPAQQVAFRMEKFFDDKIVVMDQRIGLTVELTYSPDLRAFNTIGVNLA